MSGPFDHLDPDEPSTGTDESSGPDPTPAIDPHRAKSRRRNEPGAVRAFARGARRRCPRCGGGHLFESRFRIRRRCPRCGLRLEREEGGFLGAMTINYAATAAVWLALLVAWLVVDLPDVHALALTIASIAVAVVVPLAFWPVSKTLWAAVDFLVYRADPDYASKEAAEHASGNGGNPSPPRSQGRR